MENMLFAFAFAFAFRAAPNTAQRAPHRFPLSEAGRETKTATRPHFFKPPHDHTESREGSAATPSGDPSRSDHKRRRTPPVPTATQTPRRHCGEPRPNDRRPRSRFRSGQLRPRFDRAACFLAGQTGRNKPAALVGRVGNERRGKRESGRGSEQ